MYLHETFRRAAWTVERHPAVAGTDKRPDFRIQTFQGASVVVEATSTDPPGSRGADKRRGRLLDLVDSISSPNFYLSVETFAVGPQDAPATGLRSNLTRWLTTLDPDAVESTLDPDAVEGSDYPTLAL